MFVNTLRNTLHFFAYFLLTQRFSTTKAPHLFKLAGNILGKWYMLNMWSLSRYWHSLLLYRTLSNLHLFVSLSHRISATKVNIVGGIPGKYYALNSSYCSRFWHLRLLPRILGDLHFSAPLSVPKETPSLQEYNYVNDIYMLSRSRGELNAIYPWVLSTIFIYLGQQMQHKVSNGCHCLRGLVLNLAVNLSPTGWKPWRLSLHGCPICAVGEIYLQVTTFLMGGLRRRSSWLIRHLPISPQRTALIQPLLPDPHQAIKILRLIVIRHVHKWIRSICR